jgi:hypothetical protein
MDPGSHAGFQISTKNTNLAENHPMNISGKFGSILFSGFREEDLNVKSSVHQSLEGPLPALCFFMLIVIPR